ncbi:MAG: DUF4150 domain-containing protein [Planctomycetes bacterium]|nr:DUF4150 domain-containing protein [Planctomycetota bacterium]MCB9934444.1 DUF4150 domain-containing protein [Planctomycetota bacterium]
MFPASTKMSGTCLGVPDVCKVPAPPAPPIPTPFPNTGMVMQASSGVSTKIKIENQPAILVNTKIPMSTGDEPGTLGGMISNKFKGEVIFKKGSMKVKFEGKGVCHITSITSHNGTNANMPAGAQIAPSQVMVLVAP